MPFARLHDLALTSLYRWDKMSSASLHHLTRAQCRMLLSLWDQFLPRLGTIEPARFHYLQKALHHYQICLQVFELDCYRWFFNHHLVGCRCRGCA